VHGLDRCDHRARDRRRAERRGGAEGEEKSTTGFGRTGGQGVAAPRPKAQPLEEPASSLEPTATESAEELLRAVADEEQPDRGTCQNAKKLHYDSLLSSLSVEDA
jgi:hypothetical protein